MCTKDPIYVLGATDEKYAPYYGIMLTSLFETNAKESFVVYLLCGSETAAQKLNYLYEPLQYHYKQVIRIISVDGSVFPKSTIQKQNHVSLETYFRLLGPSVLPENLNKVLWLDGDIIINGPIRELWEVDISSYAIAAVPDDSCFDKTLYDRLCLNDQFPYINAGVILFNFAYWREHDVVRRCLDSANQWDKQLLFHDQDILNILLPGKILLLPLTWNFQSGFIRTWKYPSFSEDMQVEIKNTMYTPKIIHFSNSSKPWERFNVHPYRKHFLYYKRISPWRKDKLINRYSFLESCRFFVGHIARGCRLFPPLFIMK